MLNRRLADAESPAAHGGRALLCFCTATGGRAPATRWCLARCAEPYVSAGYVARREKETAIIPRALTTSAVAAARCRG